MLSDLNGYLVTEIVWTNSRAPVSHQYNATGTYNARLTAYNTAGCDSTLCRPVRALIDPLLDVPNAFTPLSNDENSIVYVRGFGIGKITFTIWNRWGQKVFETKQPLPGLGWKTKRSSAAHGCICLYNIR